MPASVGRVCAVGAFLFLTTLPFAQEPAPRELVATFRGHTETVYSVALSPDGKQLLTGSFDRTIKLFDVASAKELRTFGGDKGHQNLVLSVAFAPDGQTFASGGSDNTARIWDVPMQKALRELTLAEAVTAAAMSVDGKSAAAGAKDGSIKLLNPTDGKELLTLKGHIGAVTALAYAPNNAQLLASVGIDGTLRFWNLADGKPVAIVVAHATPIHAVAFATGGNLVFTAGDDGRVKSWQSPPVASKPLTGHGDTVRAVALSGDGATIATASHDKSVRLFNADSGQLARTFAAANPVTGVVVAGKETIGGTATGQLIVWNGEGKVIFQAQAHTGEITALSLNSGGTQLVSVGSDGNLMAWTLPLMPAKSLPQPADARGFALSVDGKRAWINGADNQVRFVDVRSGQAEKAYPVNATVGAASADSASFAAIGPDNVLRWQKRDGGKPSELPNQPGIVALALHPNGSQLLAAHSDGSLKLWPVPFAEKAPKPIWEAKLPGVKRVIIEPKGAQFLAINADKAVHFGDLKSGKEQKAVPAHDGAISEIALSPDGTKVITTCVDTSVKVWNLADGKEIAKVMLPAAVSQVAINGKGDRLAAAHAQDGKVAVSVVDVLSGRKLFTTDARYGAVGGLAFDPASRGVFIVADKSVTLIDVPTANVLPVHPGGATSIAMLPSGHAVTGGKDKIVRQWDLTTGKEVRNFGTLPETVNAVTVTRDGAQVAAASGKSVKIWNAGDGKEVTTIAHPAEVISLAFSTDRQRLITGTTDNLARIWELQKFTELQAFSHGAAVHGVAFLPNKPNTVVTASADKSAVMHTITLQRVLQVSAKPIRALAVHPNGSHLLAGGDEGPVALVNIGNGNIERRFDGAAGPMFAVAVAKNGNLVATAGAEKIVRVFNFTDGALVGHFPTTAPVRSMSVHPNNTALFTSGDDKAVTMWNVAFQPGNPPPAEFGKPTQTFAHAAGVPAIAFNTDATAMLTACDDRITRLWKVAADGPTKTLAHPNLVDCVAYSKDGKQLATACHDGVVRIFDIEKGSVLKTINAHTQPAVSAVYCVVWSPDGKQLATGSLDKSAKVWDAASGNLVKEFKGFDEKTAPRGHRDGVFSVAFTPDGKQLVTGSSDRTIKMWNIADGAPVRDFVNPALSTSPMQPPVAHSGWVYHLRFTPGGQIVSVGGAPRNRGAIALWNPADGKLLHSAELPLGPLYHVAVTADGSQYAVACGPQARQTPHAEAVLIRFSMK